MRVTIPENCKNINVLFSGGVDSSLLLFLLMQERLETKNPVPIMCYNMWVGYQGNVSFGKAYIKVSEWISNYFNENIPVQVIPKVYIRDAVSNILLINPGYVYTGCNLVLDNKFTPSVYLSGDTPPVRGPALNEFHLRPFIDIPKDVIIQEYKRLDILELLKITVSCGVSDIPCGGCYFCMERQWGIKEVGIVI